MESQSCPSLQEESKAKANTTEEESRVTTAARLLAGFADQGRRHEPRNAAPEARKTWRQILPGASRRETSSDYTCISTP